MSGVEPKPKLRLGWAQLLEVMGRAAGMGRSLSFGRVLGKTKLLRHGLAGHFRRKGPGRYHQNGPTHGKVKRATGPGSLDACDRITAARLLDAYQQRGLFT